MLFYNDQNEKIICNKGTRINDGMFGNVYSLPNNKCLKLYKLDDFDFKPDVINEVKNLNLNNYYKINDLLFDKKGVFKGYTMDYYKDDNIDILDMPMEYTIENLRSIYKSLMTLADNNIWAQDLHSGNVILSKNDMTVIDVDSYVKTFSNYGMRVRDRNIDALYFVFRDIYLDRLKDCYDDLYNVFFNEYLKELFPPAYEVTMDIDTVSKKLTKYKKPMDFVISKGNCR